jgi:hypothetical protein
VERSGDPTTHTTILPLPGVVGSRPIRQITGYVRGRVFIMSKAIPTTYNGIRFRSRLEAKWAFMFDEFGWPYEYEPIDLNGYIPDFILKLKEPVLVEVKPIIERPKDPLQKCFLDPIEKIQRSGWEKEAIIVGATLYDSDYDEFSSIGMLGELGYKIKDNGVGFVECVDFDYCTLTALFVCSYCNKISFCSNYGSFHCRRCGKNDGGSHRENFDLSKLKIIWDKATNQVQWRKR